MKRINYFAMAALLTAGLSLSAMAQTAPAKSGGSMQSTKTASASADPCKDQKAAVTKAGKDAKAKKSAQADLKTCQDNQKKAKKKGGN